MVPAASAALRRNQGGEAGATLVAVVDGGVVCMTTKNLVPVPLECPMRQQPKNDTVTQHLQDHRYTASPSRVKLEKQNMHLRTSSCLRRRTAKENEAGA
jgi:hypothetical protein